jgi:lambda family phage portal protein
VKPSQLLGRFESAFEVLTGRPTAEQRELQQMRSAYAGAVFNRLNSDWIVAPLASDQELISDLKVLRTRARDLGRNNPFAVRMLELGDENVVGPTGIGLRGRMNDGDGNLVKGVNQRLKDGWDRFGDSVSRDGRFGLADFTQLAVQNWIQDGEVFVRMHIGREYRFGLALEFIDPDLVDETFNMPRSMLRGGNEVRLSVEVDQQSRRVGYWCYEEPILYGQSGRHKYFVPANEMIHLGRSRRVNQTRFVTWFHPVMDAMRMLDGLVEAELVASRASAAKMGFAVSKDGRPLGEKNPDGTRAPIPMEASPGSIAVMPPGYEFQGWDPQHPTTAFGTFHASMIRRIAAGLNISYTSLANDPGDANYSSSRSALQMEQRFWRKTQQFFCRQFMQRLLDEFLRTATLTGEIDLPVESAFDQLRRVAWETPGWEWIDPKSDVEAAILAISNNLDSHQRILGGRGLDFEDDVLAQRKQAQELIDAAGLAPAPLPAAEDPKPPAEPVSAS